MNTSNVIPAFDTLIAGDMVFQPPQHISDADKVHIRRMLNAINVILEKHPTAPAQLVATLLTVALREGMGNADYADMLSHSKTVTSRYLHDLGNSLMRTQAPGLGLVKIEQNPEELRRSMVTLTPRGVRTIEHIVEILSGKHENGRLSRKA